MTSVARPGNDRSVSRPPPVGVPRRFGIGSLFVLTTFSSGVFFLAQALNTPREVVVVIAVFLLIVGAAQWIIGEGQRARWASAITGGVLFGVLMAGAASMSRFGNGAAPTSLATSVDIAMLLPAFVMGFVVGGMLGYLAGTLVAGVFLIAHMADEWIARRLQRRADGPHEPMAVDE